ncbi:transcriptional regulator with XRE-family HTH domain [Hymenobacter sp. UYCo722]
MVERIRTLLESRQLTPTQFADLIGVARPIISHILSGRNKASLEVVQRILAAMPDLSMAWLLNGTEPMLTNDREAAPAMSLPQPAETAAVPLSVAPTQPTPAERLLTSALVKPVVSAQYADNQSASDDKAVSKSALVAAAVPGVPGASTAGAPVLAAGVVAVPWPRSPTAARPPMPPRFSLKQPGTGQTSAGIAAPLLHTADVPLAPKDSVASVAAPTSTPVASAMASEEIAEVTNGAFELPGKEAATVRTADYDEPLASSAAPVAASGTVIPPLAPTVAGIPPGKMPSPTPVPVVGGISGSTPTLANDAASALFTGAEKPIRRIVIFYRDGSFADYQPE